MHKYRSTIKRLTWLAAVLGVLTTAAAVSFNWQRIGPRLALASDILRGGVEVDSPQLPLQTMQSVDPCGEVEELAIGDADAEPQTNTDSQPEAGATTDNQEPIARPPDMPLINPARRSCELGRIGIEIGTEHHNGFRLGEIVPVLVTIKADRLVQFDFASLLDQRIIEFEGSDFELYGRPEISSAFSGLPSLSLHERAREALYALRFGRRTHATIVPYSPDSKVKRLWTIRLKVQSFVPALVKKAIPLTLNLNYAVGLTAGDTTPNWQVLTTPPLVVTTTTTADYGKQFLPGNLKPMQEREPVLAMPLQILGGLLVAVGLLPLIAAGVYRLIPGYKAPERSANQLAWSKLSGVFGWRKATAVTAAEWLRVAVVIKEFLGIASDTTGEALAKFGNHRRLPELRTILEQADALLQNEAPSAMSLNRKQLRKSVTAIVGRKPLFS